MTERSERDIQSMGSSQKIAMYEAEWDDLVELLRAAADGDIERAVEDHENASKSLVKYAEYIDDNRRSWPGDPLDNVKGTLNKKGTISRGPATDDTPNLGIHWSWTEQTDPRFSNDEARQLAYEAITSLIKETAERADIDNFEDGETIAEVWIYQNGTLDDVEWV